MCSSFLAKSKHELTLEHAQAAPSLLPHSCRRRHSATLCSYPSPHLPGMGKHNGKARKSGLSVGSALVNKARREGRNGGAAAFLHTTDLEPKKNMQSVIESNDLDEMMAMVGWKCLGEGIGKPAPCSLCSCTRHLAGPADKCSTARQKLSTPHSAQSSWPHLAPSGACVPSPPPCSHPSCRSPFCVGRPGRQGLHC